MKTLIWSAGPEPYSAAPPFYRAACAAGFDATIVGERSHAGAAQVINTLRRDKYDCVFSFVSLPRFNETYSAIRATGAKLLSWYPDQLNVKVTSMWKTMVGHFDVVICSSLRTANILRSMGHNTVWMPQYFELTECSPLPKRLDTTKPIYDVCFIGGFDKKRFTFMDHLAKHFKVAVYGPRENARRAIFGHDMAEVYAQSKIAINVQRAAFVLNEPTTFSVSNRIFRAMGSGCFLLHYPIPSLTPIFNLGTHYETYDGTLDDLSRKIDYWLEHDEARERIAFTGKEEVLRNHTLEHRIHQYWHVMKTLTNKQGEADENDERCLS